MPEKREQVRDAAEWRLLGLLLERPRPGWHAEVARLAAEIHDPTLTTAAAAAATAGESEYLDVFGPGGAVSPRAVAYRGREDPGGIVADVSAFYTAFAFHPQSEDPLDHVAVMASFAGYLCLKAAFARSRGQTDAASTSEAALQRFVHEHLAFVAQPLCAKIDMLSPVPHLLLAAGALLQRTGPVPPGYADAPPTDAEGDVLGCDGCSVRP